MIMAIVRITTFFKPGTSHLSSFESRAEWLLQNGILEAMPVITICEGHLKPFWVVKIECTENDRKVWLGFNEGCNLCVNNRPLMVGTE
jgi:hypothetical protein